MRSLVALDSAAVFVVKLPRAGLPRVMFVMATSKNRRSASRSAVLCLVVYRRVTAASASRRGQSPEQTLTPICDRLVCGLANAGVKSHRMAAADIHDWLLRWFNPHPTLLGPCPDDRERFDALTHYPEAVKDSEIELAGGDFAQLDAHGPQRVNVMLNAGLQPVREEDEMAQPNGYLRWLPCVFDPAVDKRQWYTQLMFAQHAANLAPVCPTG